MSYAIGLDYGTESVRAVVVERETGTVAGQAVVIYEHGVIDKHLPGGDDLPPQYALQHPRDWLTGVGEACQDAMAAARVDPEQVIGVGVDFTSCTMLPALSDGTPLCMTEAFEKVPLAWPKLWKHHAAVEATDRVNRVARERNEPWLDRYGGTIGLEWFFPKVLETLSEAPKVYEATQVWLEAGDWLVWQLTSGPYPNCQPGALARSTCQAGYKAQWNAHDGYPSTEFFAALDPRMADVVSKKMSGKLTPPGTRAGVLTPKAAELLGLKPGTPVSAAIIDAHAGVPGAGVPGADTLVMVMGTSSCHMLNSETESLAPGIAGVVADGILPGYYGYETGQASVGDAFAWLVSTLGQTHMELTQDAETLAPGSGGVLALDWLNGCRTPLMDGRLGGAFVGLKLGTRPGQMYRALLEATAFGVRWIADTLRDGGVKVDDFVASGGLPGKSKLLMQIYADVLNRPIRVAASSQSCALGAAILGALAAESPEEPAAHAKVKKIIDAMAPQEGATVYEPDAKQAKQYDTLYHHYRELADPEGVVVQTMRQLHQ